LLELNNIRSATAQHGAEAGANETILQTSSKGEKLCSRHTAQLALHQPHVGDEPAVFLFSFAFFSLPENR